MLGAEDPEKGISPTNFADVYAEFWAGMQALFIYRYTLIDKKILLSVNVSPQFLWVLRVDP